MEMFFFIAPDRGGPSLYAHNTNVQAGFVPTIGASVTFRMRTSPRTGKPEAFEIRPVADPAPPPPTVRRVEHPYEQLGDDVLVSRVIKGETPAQYYARKHAA